MSDKWFLVTGLLMATAARGDDTVLVDPSKAKPEETRGGVVQWYDARLLGVEGKAWSETESPYDRLPSSAKAKVRPAVWNLSRHSAGMLVRFATNAQSIQARWTLTSGRLEMAHMPATGVSGLDLYIKNPSGQWRWVGFGRPSKVTNVGTLVSGLEPSRHEFMLYLPLYNGVESVELGFPKGAGLWTLPRSKEQKPIVFYGTSITQGGCASRPGAVHTAILGRRLDRPVVNLGFSGNGRMEKEIAQLMGEIDACVYVVDCLPNIGAKEVSERTQPLVRELRKARPNTPIVLVEDRTYSNAPFIPSKQARHDASRRALREAYEALKEAGVEHLYYVEGEPQLGDDGEGTVDSSHPTDLGFLRMADAFEPVLGGLVNP